MTGSPSRRAVLQGLGALPVLAAVGKAGAAADDAADPAPPLSAAQRLAGFATAQAETLAAPLTTLSGRLPPALAGVLWRNGPAEHERFGHRYGHWFDGDGMVQAFTFSGSRREPPRPYSGHAEAPAGDGGRQTPPANLRHAAARDRADPLARRHERGKHLRARPWRAAHGALGRVDPRSRSIPRRSRPATSSPGGPTSRARPSRPIPRSRRTAPAGTSAASRRPSRCCSSTASIPTAGSPRSTRCRRSRSAWCTTMS